MHPLDGLRRTRKKPERCHDSLAQDECVGNMRMNLRNSDLTTRQPASADPVQVDPKHYSVELENDRVRVLRIRYGPREK